MFGFFKAKPPVSPWEKAWTENRLAWFSEQLGIERLLESDTLTLNDERIPPVSNYDEAVALLRFLGSWMKVDTGGIHLQVHSDVVSPDSVGSFDSDQQTVIKIHESQYQDRESLVATLAWQLGNELLSNGTMKEVKLADIGWTTDLLPVYFGLGLFAANQTLRPPEKEPRHFAWWGLRQRAYVPGRVFGYALALREQVRDRAPDWSASLTLDAQTALADSLKYLQKTNDTTFTRESARQPRSRASTETLAKELREGTPSRLISAMWELAARSTRDETQVPEQVVQLLTDCVRHSEAEVRAVACTTLSLFDRSQHAAMDVADSLRDSSVEVRIAAAGAMAVFAGVDDETMVHDLTDALKDSERLVVFNAARSLTHYGVAAQPALKGLLKRTRQALVECRDGDAQTLMWAVDSIVDDTEGTLNKFFEVDEEIRTTATQMWAEMQAAG